MNEDYIEFSTIAEFSEQTGHTYVDIVQRMAGFGLLDPSSGSIYRHRITPLGAAFVVLDDDELKWRPSVMHAIGM
jgi:hypothetical protein